jgi:hypothetical protein
MSHFPRYGIEAIANTEPGCEVRIANNVAHSATNDVPANQTFLYLKIPRFFVFQTQRTGLRKKILRHSLPAYCGS